MKIKTLLLIGCLMAGPAAAETPAVLQPLEGFANVVRLDDLIRGTASYRVDFCLDGDCDMFMADPEHLSILKDFSVLFVSTDTDYFGTLMTPPDNATIAAILDRGAKKYGCQAAGDETKCVLHGLYQDGKLKRYAFISKDADTYEEVDEDGQEFPGR